MQVIAKKRGSGKTYDLIRLAEQTGGIIVCLNRISTQYVMDMARHMGISIRNPIHLGELRGLDRNAKVLFDNAEHILQALLCEQYGVQPSQVAAITVSVEDEDEALQRAAQPLIDYIREHNYNQRADALVENDCFRLFVKKDMGGCTNAKSRRI